MASTAVKLTTIANNMQKVYDAGYGKGIADSRDEEIFFTNHGIMYKKNMVIDYEGNDGFYIYAYRNADKMETLSVPNMMAMYTATNACFQNCTALKSASLPKIQRIGNLYFEGCTSLTDLTLGSEEYPMVSIGVSAIKTCPSLVNFNYIGVIDSDMQMGTTQALSHDSLITILNCLVDKSASGSTGTLSLGATNLAKLSDTEKLIATNKGWTLA